MFCDDNIFVSCDLQIKNIEIQVNYKFINKVIGH